MDNSLIPQGIELVQKAIAADNAQEHAQALSLYRDALARFTMGLKYEKNEARKKLILERVEGYMKRAEELSDFLKKQNELDKNGGGGVAAKNKEDGEDSLDAETKKLRGSLSAAIVTEKPNVKWDDVAGLENAKESLKEVRQSCLEIACLLACLLALSTMFSHHQPIFFPTDCHSPHQISPALHWQTQALQGHPSLWTTWNGQELPRQGRRHRGRLHLL